MPKQKIKHPVKPAALGGGDDGAVVATMVSPSAKSRGKRKTRLRLDDGAPGKKGPLKRVGKTKKVSRNRVASLASAVATLAGTVTDALPAAIAEPGRKAIHKIKRPAARLGALERLQLAVEEVRLGGRVSARTRKLQMSGVPKMAQKVIEEAGEVAIEAVLGNRVALVNESADLLYNLIVLLTAADVTIDVIWAEMDRRALTLGMAEKLPKTIDPDV